MLKHIISTYRHEFRMWMRQRTRPLSIEEAEEKRFFWAKMYATTSLLLLILCTYNLSGAKPRFNKTDDAPEELASSFVFSADKPVRVIKYDGFTKVRDVTYSTEELSKFIKVPSNKSSVIKNPENSVTD